MNPIRYSPTPSNTHWHAVYFWIIIAMILIGVHSRKHNVALAILMWVVLAACLITVVGAIAIDREQELAEEVESLVKAYGYDVFVAGLREDIKQLKSDLEVDPTDLSKSRELRHQCRQLECAESNRRIWEGYDGPPNIL